MPEVRPAAPATRSPPRPRARRPRAPRSPRSSLPLGNDQSSYLGRCTSSTSRPRPEDHDAGGDHVRRLGHGARVVALGSVHHAEITPRLLMWGAVAVALVIAAAAVVVGIRWWNESHRTDLEQALAMAPQRQCAAVVDRLVQCPRGARPGPRRRPRRRGRRRAAGPGVRGRPHPEHCPGRLGGGDPGRLRLLSGNHRLGAVQPVGAGRGGDGAPAGVDGLRRDHRLARRRRIRRARARTPASGSGATTCSPASAGSRRSSRTSSSTRTAGLILTSDDPELPRGRGGRRPRRGRPGGPGRRRGGVRRTASRVDLRRRPRVRQAGDEPGRPDRPGAGRPS